MVDGQILMRYPTTPVITAITNHLFTYSTMLAIIQFRLLDIRVPEATSVLADPQQVDYLAGTTFAAGRVVADAEAAVIRGLYGN